MAQLILRRHLIFVSLAASFAAMTSCGDGEVARAPARAEVLSDEDARLAGLTARPANGTCRAFTAPPTNGPVILVDRFPGIPLDVPTGLFQRPGDNQRWYVTERAGRIVHFPNVPSATSSDLSVALDLRDVTMADWDCSLAGVAFPPDFAARNDAFMSYCYLGPETGGKLQIRVSRFTTNDGGDTFDRASEAVLVALDHPGGDVHQYVGLHAANVLRFGPDGYLYVAIGDGGPQGKIGGQQAQDTNDLRGKLLRIDVSDATLSLAKDFVPGRQRVAAKFPADNPFVSGGGNAAVYAYGFRNPWQWHFDRGTGTIWLGDVGDNSREEINRDVVSGGNYGWSIFEGTACTNYFGAASCNDPTLIPPLLDYQHGYGPDLGNSVTGGVVYRGTAVPSLTGSYIFGDASTAHVWAVRDVDALPAGMPAKELIVDGAPVSSFAEDQDGELFATILYSTSKYPSGKILALETATVVADQVPGGPPALLSQTGCFEASDAKTPVAALVPYEPSAQLWSDGATKRRWVALPDGAQIALRPDGSFDFPPGAVLVKEFAVDGRRVETRFFVRQADNAHWVGYTYAWNDDQSDATLVGPEGAQIEVSGRTWNVPTQAQCYRCHTNTAGSTLGLELGQLNHDIIYPATGRIANQLFTLSAIGYLPEIDGAPPGLARIDDSSRSVEERARAYLHVNCANCHRPGGPTFTPLDLRWSVPLQQMGICDELPTIDDLAAHIPSEPRLLAPGAPERSVLYRRLSTTDPAIQMPPLGRSLSDPAASSLVSDWITGLTSCL